MKKLQIDLRLVCTVFGAVDKRDVSRALCEWVNWYNGRIKNVKGGTIMLDKCEVPCDKLAEVLDGKETD